MEEIISEIILKDKEEIGNKFINLINKENNEKLNEKSIFSKYKIYNGNDVLKNVSKINVFVGANNSGKSRFLRELFKKQLCFYSNKINLDKFSQIINEMQEEIKSAFNNNGAKFNKSANIVKGYPNLNNLYDGKIDLEVVNKKTLNLRTYDYLTSGIDYLKEIKELINSMEEKEKLSNRVKQSILGDVFVQKEKPNSKTHESVNEKEPIYIDLEKLADRYKEKIKDYDEMNFNFKKVYIPTLRGIRNISSDNNDVYNERTRNDYFEEDTLEECEIFTGLTLYEDVKKLLLGDLTERKHIREFEKFLSKEFFDNKEVTLIPKYNDKNLWVKIGEDEYSIFNLGDGIQSIIILTFPLFKYRDKNLLLFIEEPELFIHPGLQRKFIETISSDEFSKCQIFLTTHSNHFLDMTLDVSNISIYQFNKTTIENNKNEFIIQNIDNPSISILNELGVRNSSVFLSNCTIWVEGITDRFYIRKFFSVYQNEMFKEGKIKKIYDEDIHYSFVEYSGGNITHWSFLDDEGEQADCQFTRNIDQTVICNKIFLIADSDGYNKEEKKDYVKAKRLVRLKRYFDKNFYCTECKEIENMLTPDTIKMVVKKFKCKRSVEDLGEDKDGEIFEKNKFFQSDYKDENLGLFIDKKIDEFIADNQEEYNQYIRRKSFTEGNSIKNKKVFCEYAIKGVETLSDISEEAYRLCEMLYEFIKNSNV